MRAVVRAFGAAAIVAALGACASSRDAGNVGSYVDDAAITTTVKARMVEDNAVDPAAISVETKDGSVTLSGVARNSLEKSTAESIAMKVRGVKAVQNNLSVRP